MTGGEMTEERRAKNGTWPIPVFTLPIAPRAPGDTESQHAAYRRGVERHARALGVYLAFFQLLCTRLEFHRGCRRGACRRLKRCAGRNPQDDWSTPFRPVVPPCVGTDIEVIEAMRAEIRSEIAFQIARHGRPEEAGEG